ncbi:enoyl-CoA hydratase/isomerase family protein [bacterium]|nr:enoyl-CoA hydratase/isomerase family protein [bacterium]
MTDEVIIRKEGVAGRITLNRPQALHALNRGMCVAMDEALRAWADDPSIELVLVDHADGTRGFCAGGDIRMLAESGAGDGLEAAEFFRAEYRLNARIKSYPKPYVAIIDGVTMGGGVGVSVHGSHRVATGRTVFAMPETGIGLFPDVGGGWFLPRLPGGLAMGMWLALTGQRLKGADVVAAGVATHLVEEADIPDLKRALSAGRLEAVSSHAGRLESSFGEVRGELERCFGAQSIEGVLSALESEGESGWAAAQLAALRTKSPQTLKVAHRQLSLGSAMEHFEDNMRMEFRIGCRAVKLHDFQEGVRAVIIDKDGAPRWKPARVEEVSDELLDTIFAPLKPGEPAELTFD